MIYILIAILVLIATYVLAMRGRVGNKKLAALKGWCYAHRGLHGKGVPENSMLAFRKAKQAGYGIELDVHLTKDGTLVVIHDSKLLRTAGVDVYVEDIRLEDLSRYYLEGTFETIPVFQDVLKLVGGTVPLIIELKSDGDNYGRLCNKVCRALDGYKGIFCLESFDPRCVHWLKKHAPALIRGQLTENFLRTEKCTLPWIVKVLLSNQLFNFLTAPDFVAYKFADRKHVSNLICRKAWKMTGVTWTIKRPEELELALKEDWITIFEGFLP